MKKVLIALMVTICLTIPALASESDDLGHLFAGSFVAEHLKRKECDPLTTFVITAGLGFVKELWDNDFSTRDLSFTIGGVFFSYGFDEIGKFILNGIDDFNKSNKEVIN